MSKYVLVDKAELEKNIKCIEALKEALASEPQLSSVALERLAALSPVQTLQETLAQAKQVQVKAQPENPNRLFQNRRYPAVSLDESVIAPLYGNGKV